MDYNLNYVKTNIYDKCSFVISNLEIEPEGKEYSASRFELNGKKILCRTAKVTPKKVGQFVSCWKRNKEGITEPFSDTDMIDFYVIHVKSGNNLGQFVFPSSELISKGILSTEEKDGKRGFRVYPKWDKPVSKQAEKAQKWQLDYFLEINDSTDFKKVANLYKNK